MLEYLIELKIHIQANYYFQSFCLCCCFTAKDSKIIAGNIDAYNIGPPFPRENEQGTVLSNDHIYIHGKEPDLHVKLRFNNNRRRGNHHGGKRDN